MPPYSSVLFGGIHCSSFTRFRVCVRKCVSAFVVSYWPASYFIEFPVKYCRQTTYQVYFTQRGKEEVVESYDISFPTSSSSLFCQIEQDANNHGNKSNKFPPLDFTANLLCPSIFTIPLGYVLTSLTSVANNVVCRHKVRSLKEGVMAIVHIATRFRGRKPSNNPSICKQPSFRYGTRESCRIAVVSRQLQSYLISISFFFSKNGRCNFVRNSNNFQPSQSDLNLIWSGESLTSVIILYITH